MSFPTLSVSGMADCTTYSLFNTLTKHDVYEVPASIDLIDFLLKAVGHEVCGATRNTQSLYRFVSHARDLATKIGDLITRVGKPYDDASALDDFENYTQMIGPLEDELFKVISIFPEENDDLLSSITTKPPETDVELLVPYNSWKTNRAEIRSAYSKLQDDKIFDGAGLAPDDISAVPKYDDLSWLAQLSDNISTHTIKGTPSQELLAAVKDVANRFDEILQALRSHMSPPEDSVILAIRAAIVSFTAICMIDPMKVATLKEKELQKRLQEPKETWKRALGLLQKILTAIKTNQPLDDTSESSTEWTAFEVYLMGEALASSIPIVIKLLKYIAEIKRHYYSQSIPLVRLCIGLEAQAKTRGLTAFDEGLNTRDVQKIEEVLDAAKAALSKATEVITALLSNQALDNSCTNGPSPEYDAAVTRIKTAYDDHSFILDTASATDAKETDKKVSGKLGAHWDWTEDRSMAPVARIVNVNNTLYDDKPAQTGGTPKMTLEDPETLEPVIWKRKPGVDLPKPAPQLYKKVGNEFVEVTATDLEEFKAWC
ncbi:hypothetical protein FRB93_004243 [Tulasnella sp. JGI-2019a]|nr:hypothetical protein FRB93_004243 [Tulasnella sp. JGI-2019a]